MGSMSDNQVEGWSGFRIDQVSDKSNLSTPSFPNVITVLVGTNDALQGYKSGGMAQRMGDLLDKLFLAVPQTTVILSTLPPNGKKKANIIAEQYNAQLFGVVATRFAAGKKVFLVDCSSTVSFHSIH
jgi:lysophospholipase L1-like esterase